MSQKNSEIKPENKTLFPSIHDSYKESVLFQKNNLNHIIIDSDPRTADYKNSTTNFEKNKYFNSTNYEMGSKGNEFKLNGNGLFTIKNKNNLEDSKFSKTYYKNEKATVKSLKKKLNELNGEINKLRNDSNVQNYNILELNYKQKSKELTELKQENNFIRFQLENLIRKNKNNNAKNNNFINNNGNKKKSKNNIFHIRNKNIKIYKKKAN